MVIRTLLTATFALAAAAPVAAADMGSAPPGNAGTRYCMRIEAVTGTRVESVKCWTRAKWESQGVDVDADWAAEGVRTED